MRFLDIIFNRKRIKVDCAELRYNQNKPKPKVKAENEVFYYDLGFVENIYNDSTMKVSILENNYKHENVIKLTGKSIDKVSIEEKNNILKIRNKSKNSNIVRNKDILIIEIYTDLSKITYLETSSVGDLFVEKLLANRINIKMSSVGNINVKKINSNILNIDKTSVGDLSIKSGEINRLNLISEGCGDIYLKKVIVNDAKIKSKNIGDITLNIFNQIEGSIGGVGDLLLYGELNIVDVKEESVGEIKIIWKIK